MAWLRHVGREGGALDRVSSALRAGASDFGKTRSLWQITPKVFSPDKPPASRVPSSRPMGRTDRRRRHFGLGHPWLRPKPASNIPVLAPHRGRAVLALIRFSPYAGCAIIPDGAPDPLNSTRRFAGGPFPLCPPVALVVTLTTYMGMEFPNELNPR